MDKKRINILFQKHLAGELNPVEWEELKQGMQMLDEETFSAWVDEYVEVEENHNFSKDAIRDGIASRIAAEDRITPIRRLIRHPLIAVAAMLFLVLSIVFWLYRSGESEESLKLVEKEGEPTARELILPDDEAMVTLADGTQMLFSTNTVDTVRHKGLEIVRTADGSIVMKQENSEQRYFGEDARHSVVAPKGVALHIVLPDSSSVWLNSGSSIRIWASYNQQNRSVELNGEGYFDVQHDKNRPFYVAAKDVKVKVLGTTFNLSAYEADEEVKTTLVEGSVNVSASGNSLILRPGEQAVVNEDASMQLRKDVNMNLVAAWKDGFFRFRDESIADIMRELQKWYPISAVEIAAGNTDKFTASIRRSKKLTDILTAMEEVSDLSFSIKEGRVIVKK